MRGVGGPSSVMANQKPGTGPSTSRVSQACHKQGTTPESCHEYPFYGMQGSQVFK